jgi:hypothetical protein
VSAPPLRVSDLAAFAADPDGFVARRGAPHSAAAAAAGERYHRAFGRAPRRWRWIVLALGAVAAAVLYGWLT